MINKLLLLIVVVLLLEATIWATRPACGRKAALRSIGRPVSIPAKEKTLSSRLLKSLSGLKEKVQYGGTAAVDMLSRLNRDATAYFSSDFEALLLQMTSPTGSMTSQGDIDRFVATTKSYVRNGDLLSQSNTYRVTLRKLWAKITERDYRTELKALYALHTLLRTCSARDGKIYHDLVWRLSREYSKKSGSRHFTARKPTGSGHSVYSLGSATRTDSSPAPTTPT
jgi:hypothetical protein